MMARPRLAAPTSADADRMIVRRQCACGAKAGPVAQSCPDCERKKLQPKLVVGSQHAAEEREADRVADAVMRGGDGRAGVGAISAAVQRSSAGPAMGIEPQAPPIVDRVLERSGQALDSGAKRFFERRFERDFSNVRVHADAEAAASARAVDAHAYTLGNHLVFAASRYAPDTLPGRRLLAHELTHVVQQGATLRRRSISPSLILDGEGGEDEQPVQRLRRQPAIVGLDQAGPAADLTGKSDNALVECMKGKVDPQACVPATPPGWASFTAANPTLQGFDAETTSGIEAVDVPSQQCIEQITGRALGPKKRFQGLFYPKRSWVDRKFVDAGDPSKNGSAGPIGACEAFFASGQTGTRFLKANPPTCTATIMPRGDVANNFAQCTTVLGKDYTDTQIAESMRLLKHEQTHFALTCALARKGNAVLAEAKKTFEQVNAVIHTKLNSMQTQYDNETDHGCKAGPQASWETAISTGLPDVEL